jgi:ssDNA thymidine ADP-ribosyltransferase, DarT
MELDAFLTKVRASTQFNYFYHFTDKKNLDSVRERGLLCTKELRRLDIFKTVVPGGDATSQASDTKNGTDKYVCLCFTNTHPMCHIASQRGIDPTWLSINPDVIKAMGVKIADAPSNQNGVVPQDPSAALDNLHLDAIYNFIDWGENPEAHAQRIIAEKYEILVPKQVVVDYIVKGL